MTQTMGVAISTTGDDHRLGLLSKSAEAWWLALAPFGLPVHVYVTVDGDDEAVEKVRAVVAGHALVAKVGQVRSEMGPQDGSRLGVAANKNTGIEILMDAGVEHLFLSDDDTWPLMSEAMDQHLALGRYIPHSMVCWPGFRHPEEHMGYATWDWPRGVMLYQTRAVIETVGGMIEAFGHGGHEHVEFSRRVHQAGLTPHPCCTPSRYTKRGPSGAAGLWHAEDMPLEGENLSMLRSRRDALTTLRRGPGDEARSNEIFNARDRDTTFVPYRAAENGRGSATLYHN